MRLRRTRLSDLDPCIGRLEGDLVTAVAERAVGGSAAAAEGERSLPRQVVFVALGVHHFDNAVGIVYAQRTVVAHLNRDLRHETSIFETIAPWTKLPVLGCQFSLSGVSKPKTCGVNLAGTDLNGQMTYRHRSTASNHTIFNHSSKVVFAHSRFVHQAAPNCAGLRAAAALNWYCGRRWRKISKARRV